MLWRFVSETEKKKLKERWSGEWTLCRILFKQKMIGFRPGYPRNEKGSGMSWKVKDQPRNRQQQKPKLALVLQVYLLF